MGWGRGSAPTCCVRHDQSLLERLLQWIAELLRPTGSWRLPRALAVGTASPAPQPGAVLRLASRSSVTVGVHCGSSAPSSACSASPRRASTGAAARPRRTAATLWAGGPRSSSTACTTALRTRHVNSTCRGLPARMWQWQWQWKLHVAGITRASRLPPRSGYIELLYDARSIHSNQRQEIVPFAHPPLFPTAKTASLAGSTTRKRAPGRSERPVCIRYMGT